MYVRDNNNINIWIPHSHCFKCSWLAVILYTAGLDTYVNIFFFFFFCEFMLKGRIRKRN
jgi:hypothetical protein